MATRDVLDERIDIWRDAYRDDQQLWRVTLSTTGNYGQVLRGNLRPSDQPEDGPLLPPMLKGDGWIDVYEAPNGFGWCATFEAKEPGVFYRRSLSCHEDGPLTETAWVLWVEPEISGETAASRMWAATKRVGAEAWKVLNAPVGDLWRA